MLSVARRSVHHPVLLVRSATTAVDSTRSPGRRWLSVRSPPSDADRPSPDAGLLFLGPRSKINVLRALTAAATAQVVVCYGAPLSYLLAQAADPAAHIGPSAVAVSALAMVYSSMVALGVRFYTSRFVVAIRRSGRFDDVSDGTGTARESAASSSASSAQPPSNHARIEIGTLNVLGSAVNFYEVPVAHLLRPALRSRRFPHWVGLRAPRHCVRLCRSIGVAQLRGEYRNNSETRLPESERLGAYQLRLDVEQSLPAALSGRAAETKAAKSSRRVFIVDAQGDLLQPDALRSLLLDRPPA